MSSLNVRFAQKTRGKTDLLNCTNRASSDRARLIQEARAGAHQESNSRANTPGKCTQAVFIG